MNWNMSLLPVEAYPSTPPVHEHASDPAAAVLGQAAPALPKDALLIDVRSYAEFMAGHLPGAHCLPMPRLEEQIRLLATDAQTPLIVYCASGARAELALGLLQRLGYRQAHYGGSAVELAKQLNTRLQPGM
nr:rhodanese-like domain-containing protein [uncultured Roseateles sp.]